MRTVKVSTSAARKAGAKGRTLRVALPRNLKPGRHSVKVTVQWQKRELFGSRQKKMVVRVKR